VVLSYEALAQGQSADGLLMRLMQAVPAPASAGQGSA
jgi:hypothetical protein